MLSKADDFPIHQTPEPIAYAGSDRNFYDRYFFNGYTPDGEVFFAVALGVYPLLNLIDASFAVVVDGVQRNLHASRFLNMERMDTRVGPISVDVLEPLQSLRIRVESNEYAIAADLTFHGRAPAVEEPRFTRRVGPRTLMDLTRMTQNGAYEGWIEIAGRRIEVRRDAWLGTRDRSWGIRPIGAFDAQPMQPPMPLQFYWLWAPLNFEDRITLFHVNDDEQGRPWNTAGVMSALGRDAVAERMARARCEVRFAPGSRHAAAATITFESYAGETARIELTPRWRFFMMGLGYGHPEWGHGAHKGESAVGYDEIVLNDVDGYFPPHLHVQAFCTAESTLADGAVRRGAGVLEQFILGPHAPSGFTDLLDPGV